MSRPAPPPGISCHPGEMAGKPIDIPEAGDPDYTYDCWKAILHETDDTPSTGRYIKDIAADPRIKTVYLEEIEGQEYPQIILHNIWNDLGILDVRMQRLRVQEKGTARAPWPEL
ncbi:unnamed protein product, partial [Mesorhabditis spiculigera]